MLLWQGDPQWAALITFDGLLQDEDLQNQLESLRSKFRTVIAIMGIQDEILLPSTAAEALTF